MLSPCCKALAYSGRRMLPAALGDAGLESGKHLTGFGEHLPFARDQDRLEGKVGHPDRLPPGQMRLPDLGRQVLKALQKGVMRGERCVRVDPPRVRPEGPPAFRSSPSARQPRRS